MLTGGDFTLIHEAAEHESILAQSLYSGNAIWTTNALNNHDNDPAVLFNLGCNLNRCDLLRKSAELGHIDAMIKYAEVGYSKFDIARLVWYTPSVWSTRTGRKHISRILALYPNIPNQFLYHLGVRLKSISGDINATISHFSDRANAMCRSAINAWLIIARRLHIVKDVRCIIGKLLWKCAWKWIEKEDYKGQCKIDRFFVKRVKINTRDEN